MKRYGFTNPYGIEHWDARSDGEFAAFADVQQLARDVLPYLELLFKLGDGEHNEKDLEILARLKSIAGAP